jgi:hypothetical protein
LEEFKRFGPAVVSSKNDAVQQPAVLLLRLFAPGSLHPEAIRSQWQDKARHKLVGKDSRPLVRNREVLAAPLRTWQEWDGYPHLMADPAPITLQLTAGVERLFASFDQSEESERAKRKWLDELSSILARVTEPEHVDRFVMVRLVDLVASPALRERDELRLAVVRLLVE